MLPVDQSINKVRFILNFFVFADLALTSDNADYIQGIHLTVTKTVDRKISQLSMILPFKYEILCLQTKSSPSITYKEHI